MFFLLLLKYSFNHLFYSFILSFSHSLNSEVEVFFLFPTQLLNIIIVSHTPIRCRGTVESRVLSLLAISGIHSMFSLFLCLIWSLFNDMCVDVSFFRKLFFVFLCRCCDNSEQWQMFSSSLGCEYVRACRPCLCVNCVRVQILSILNP